MLSGAYFAAGIVAAILYLPRTNSQPRWKRSIRKTLPVALFALAAGLGNAPVLLTTALILSAIGDLALSRPGTRAFLVGMIAFALAHIAYIALMVPQVDMPVLMIVPVMALVMFGVSTERWLAPHTGELRMPVRAYVMVIMIMGIAALGLIEVRPLAFVGALLFVVSDLVLSLETFVMGADHRRRIMAGKTIWVTYIAAQACLLLGLGL
ncbi:MAG: lysoplasmalogenase [Rhodobacterales bacterium]|nr:lysoplasmalogenase [Rhodobacterales bacterium]